MCTIYIKIINQIFQFKTRGIILQQFFILVNLIFEWKELLEKNVGHINYIYLYTPYGLVEESLPFLVILNDLKLIDKTIHVRTTVYNEKNKNYTSEWNDEFKVGISEKGPWGFDFSK